MFSALNSNLIYNEIEYFTYINPVNPFIDSFMLLNLLIRIKKSNINIEYVTIINNRLSNYIIV